MSRLQHFIRAQCSRCHEPAVVAVAPASYCGSCFFETSLESLRRPGMQSDLIEVTIRVLRELLIKARGVPEQSAAPDEGEAHEISAS